MLHVLWHRFTHSMIGDLALVASIMLTATIIGVWLSAVWSPL